MQATAPLNRKLEWLGAAFLFSGAAGLIYQVAWQRILFASFGIDLISVSIIVSAFMLGLGIGALAGGWAGDHWPHHALTIFALSEAGIGLFGLLSPYLMRGVAAALPDASLGMLATANFALVLLPTVLMGATLPVLIAHVVRIRHTVGFATGHLYAVNTFGAMLGAIGTGFILFIHFTLDTVIYMAAGINLLVALGVYGLLREAP